MVYWLRIYVQNKVTIIINGKCISKKMNTIFDIRKIFELGKIFQNTTNTRDFKDIRHLRSGQNLKISGFAKYLQLQKCSKIGNT